MGVAFSTGEEFDASWNRGTPLQFQLGGGQVITGWDQGVQGMKVGGRRQLTIPAHLAYGDQAPAPAIKPGETLIFVCDLLGSLIGTGSVPVPDHVLGPGCLSSGRWALGFCRADPERYGQRSEARIGEAKGVDGHCQGRAADEPGAVPARDAAPAQQA